ncbi:maintenance of telomere capping protein 1 [Spinellus fusiger]|nr:maintenance of telomere capping protein 1 [Spinellus fusiger]
MAPLLSFSHVMATPTPPAPKAGSNSLSEAEKFLESLDLPETTTEAHGTTDTTDSKDIMSFLDEIAQYPPVSSTEQDTYKPTSEKTKDTLTSSGNIYRETEPQTTAAAPSAAAPSAADGWVSWGNSLWTQASAAVKTTTEQINLTVATDSAKLLEDRVKKIQGLVNKENIEKLGSGLRTLTVQSMNTLMETIAPPISEHELVEIWLSPTASDIDGVESLVHRAFSRVMEHTETGQVVVHREQAERETVSNSSMVHRLKICEGAVEGTKMAKASIDQLIQSHYTPAEPTDKPTAVISCPVFMSIQPIKHSVPVLDEEDTETHQLMFAILLVDPTHHLQFKTYSQSIPLSWLEIVYEENEWVEDKMTGVLRGAVTTVAQDYVWTRMTGGKTRFQAVASTQEGEEKTV